MTSEKIKVSDYIVKRLAEKHGVRQVFLIPGGGAMHLNDAFGNHPDISYVCNHHEQASALAAEGYARISGKLGVVNVTSGPGGFNTLTGVLGQWTDSVPVLYISGQIKQEVSVYSQPELSLRQLGDQESDVMKVVAPITKFAETLRDAKDTRRLIDKAVHLATSGRPGPVWIDVPLDVQGALVDEADMVSYEPSEDPIRSDAPEKIDAVLALLMQAKRPVIVAGHGIRISGAKDIFLKLVEKLKIPVLSTFNGVDVIATANPYYIGRIGTLGGRAGNFALQNSDLMISIGSRNNTRQISYFWKSYARAARKVVVDIDENELKKHTLVPDLPVLMDAKQFVEGMLEKAQKLALPDFSWWQAWCLERKQKYPTVPQGAPSPDSVRPYAFVQRLSQLLPEDAVVVAGNGTACVAAFQAAEVKGRQRYVWNSGSATMGYDLPAAIGASVALGKGVVACLAGDGSIMMNLQELVTIVYHQLPVKIFLLNNNGYISMRQTQKSFFEGRLTGADPSSGVGFPEFIKMAQAFGFKTECIAQDSEVEAKIAKVMDLPGPVLCEVLFPADYIFAPKLSSAKLPDGRMVSKPLEDLSPLLERDEFMSNMLIPALDTEIQKPGDSITNKNLT